MTTLETIKQQLNSVPTLPGVYLWKNADGEVIYVGKAKQLRARMRQYVNFEDNRPKIPLLVEQIASFDYIVVENEHEALVLEKNLINRYSPYFNVDFRDDKSYPFIALTKADPFPAIKYTRERHRAGTKYFGPYTDARAARTLVDVVRKVCPICSASCADWRHLSRLWASGKARTTAESSAAGVSSGEATSGKPSGRPCFDYHVGLGPGVCCGMCSREDYAKRVERAERFLSGHYQEFIDELRSQMAECAANLDFEQAGRIKQRIDVIEGLTDKQHAVLQRSVDVDVIGFYREETIAGVNVFVIRDGRIINSNEFILNKGNDVPGDELSRMFLLRYYDTTMSIPREVIVRDLPEDASALEEWLTERLNNSHGAKVHLMSPRRGERAELLSLAERNARHVLLRYMVRTNYEDGRTNEALLQLESALALPAPPMRIECFDISTIHGSYTVASMVVFTAGKPDKSQYRRFKIRTPLDEANDFVSMQEVLQRRYCKERLEDKRFGEKPDLVILDGGKPQLTAALAIFQELGITDIALCGLAKRDEEIFVPWQDGDPVVLPAGSASLYLVKQVRDEAHRFAITFHRELRGKGMARSVLDSVAGIGPERRKALMRHYSSFKRLREASLDDIRSTHILPDDVAVELFRVLSQYNNRTGVAAGQTRDTAPDAAAVQQNTLARQALPDAGDVMTGDA